MSGEPFMETLEALEEIDKNRVYGGAHLFKAKLAKQDLPGENIANCNGDESDFTLSDLKDANLSRSSFRKAKFAKSILTRANFYESNLFRVRAQGADLRHADLRNVNLQSAVLTNANLSNARFENTNLSKVDLTGALLSGTEIWKANLSQVKGGLLVLDGAAALGSKVVLYPTATVVLGDHDHHVVPEWRLAVVNDGMAKVHILEQNSTRRDVVVMNSPEGIECMDALFPLIQFHMNHHQEDSEKVVATLTNSLSVPH